ncbi:MAG TPA: chemotaxis protein CheW [Solirubrobacteraceae bacterium]|jgi:purine-binding chemotaxis protein CheW|nr:chemotaxis protein CheW [Solirubrobacteraceae bacterium]
MTSTEPERQLVLFSLHGEQYAFPIAAVREIIRYTPPSATAAVTGLITGLINLRGRVVPIVDLSPRLGRQLEIDKRTRILVVEVANGVLGVIVDSVDGVRDIPADKIEPLPVAPSEAGLGDQIAAIGDRLIVLVDPERALGGILPAPRPAGPHPAGDP